MTKCLADLYHGEAFIHNGYLYRATKKWHKGTSQYYCEKLAFKMGDSWHICAGGSEWFDWYIDVQLAKIVVVPS